MSLSDSCTVLSFSQASGCSADSPISLASSPASSVSSVSLAEESFHRKSSCSADSPISLASSPETSATSCDTLPVPGREALEANPGLDSDSGATTWSSSSSPVAADNATIPIPDNGDRI
ncbi:hypothetical protein IF1G_10837 [Cordyceps javanica]|uniref:Uncharacterized protein n=1 Tax=Cordyceps javanica TaxID=43265 RepID=A0A545UM34_9HYPO|nr:hypothetical protein IF1G_10837 [Cordyceps javanica]